MRFTTVQVILLLVGVSSALVKNGISHHKNEQKRDEGRKKVPDGKRLFARETCTSGTTCAECFGVGNIGCDVIGCYNPDAGEQCCAGGTYCVGPDTSCCDNGAGVPFDDSTGSPTVSDTPTGTGSTFPSSTTCTTSDDCEVCFGPGNINCDYDGCYNPSAGEQCCAGGTYCVGPDTSCCDNGPGFTGATSIGDFTSTDLFSFSTDNPFSTPTGGATQFGPEATDSQNTQTVNPLIPTTTRGLPNAGATGAIGGLAAVAALGLVGLAAL